MSELRTVAAMQPYVFPYIGYFQLLHAADSFVFLDDVNFIKKGWINRNYLFSKQAPVLFTIPIKSVSQNTLIKDAEIFDGENWSKKILKQIEQGYAKAPEFEHVFPQVARVFEEPCSTIAEMAIRSITAVFRYVYGDFDYRLSSSLSLEPGTAGEKRILEICKLDGAARYINPLGGVELYSSRAFGAAGLDLKFLKTRPMTYRQFGKPVERPYSMIDVMMFNGVPEIRKLMEEYDLIDAPGPG